jgi:soluble lytic murein transglycosylase-like protein
MSQQELIEMAKTIATNHGLDPTLVCAIVEQESSWNTWAIRYEPNFYLHYIRPMAGLSATEAYARAFSFGLLQLMGECARENGYKGDLAAICDPETGLNAGCIHFKRKLETAQGDVTKALLLWNGGAAPGYPAEVMARVPKYKSN